MFRRRSAKTADETDLKPGTVMADKTLFGGEIGGMQIFAMPEDVQDDEGDRNKLMTRAQALEELARMNDEGRYGHSDWELATPAEMKMLIGNLSKTFNGASAKGVVANCYLTSMTVKNGDTLDVKAVNARNNEVFFAPEINDMSVRFIRRVRPDVKPEVASTPHVPAKAGKKDIDSKKLLKKMLGDPSKHPAPGKAIDILSRALEEVPEQKKHELLDNLLYESICNNTSSWTAAVLVVDALLKAGANPNAEFDGFSGQILARTIGTNPCLEEGKLEVAKLLYRHGANLNDAVYFMTMNENDFWNVDRAKSWWKDMEIKEAERNAIIAARKPADIKTVQAATKAAEKGKNRASSAARKKEQRLTDTFNLAAQMVDALTALQAVHPQLEFNVVEKEDGMVISTNIPVLKGNGEVRKNMDITIKDKVIRVDVDYWSCGMAYQVVEANARVKNAVKCVAKHLGKRGLAS